MTLPNMSKNVEGNRQVIVTFCHGLKQLRELIICSEMFESDLIKIPVIKTKANEKNTDY